MAITYTSGEQVEVYRFGIAATILIPLTAVFLQAFLPLRLHFFSIFDLPLLVTISFAIARRSQVAGIFTGALQLWLTPLVWLKGQTASLLRASAPLAVVWIPERAAAGGRGRRASRGGP